MHQVISNKYNGYIIINGTEEFTAVYNNLGAAHYDCLQANIRQLKVVVKDMLEKKKIKYKSVKVVVEELYYVIQISLDVAGLDNIMIYHSIFYATNELTEEDINHVVEMYDLYNKMKIKELNDN